MMEQFFVHPVTKKCFHAMPFFITSAEYVSGDISDFKRGDHEHDYIKDPIWMPLEQVDGSFKMYNPVDTLALIRLASFI